VTVTRAAFLRLCGMALAGARLEPRLLAGSATVAVSSGAAGAFRVADATASHFLPLVDQPFAVAALDSSAPARLLLAGITERPMTKNVAQFSLLFHGPSARPLADGIHRFHHPALGSFSIFVSAVGVSTAGRREYQACFSRHVRT
jgi:hypothetical protein